MALLVIVMFVLTAATVTVFAPISVQFIVAMTILVVGLAWLFAKAVTPRGRREV